MNKLPIIAFGLAASVSVCAAAQAEITIGVSVAVTGPAASIGLLAKNAVEIMPTTIAGETVKFIILDDGSDPRLGVQNAKKFTDEDHVDAILGSTPVPVCLAIANVALATKTPQLCFGPAPTGNPFIFSAAHPMTLMVAASVADMKARGFKTVGFIGFSDALGDDVLKNLTSLAEAAGIKLVASERYARTDTSVTAQALKLQAAAPDAVLVGASSTAAALPQVTMVEHGYSGQFYQTPGAFSRDFIRVGGKAVEGTIAPIGPAALAKDLPDSNPIKQQALAFAQLYDGKYGAGSTNYLSGIAWDDYVWLKAAIPVALTKAKPGTPEFRLALRDALEGLKDVVGADSIVTMTPQNHNGMDLRSVVMAQVKDGTFRVMQK